MNAPEYEYLRKLLKERSGLDLSADKQYLIESRLLPLARKAGLSGIPELVQKLQGGSSALITSVVEAMTTNETFFFRDKVPFDHFRDTIMPEVLKARAGRRSVRIWCAAGSTGQEPYSLAMTLKEMSAALSGWRIEIVATDLSQEVLEKAKAGVYSQFEVQRGLGINQMIRWFEETSDGWRAVEPLRKPVRFQVHNILEPAPHPGDFDIVLCRNVLLYLSPEKKTLAFERIAGAMAEDGWLMLGAGETVIGQTGKLGSDINARGLYRLVGDGNRIEKRGGPDRRAASGA